MGNDADEEKGDGGHDGQQNTLIYVSGVAAVLLLVMLVWAVMDTADSSQRRDSPGTYAPAISTTPTTTSRKTSTTSRTTSPRISTTDMNPTPASPTPTSPLDTAGELTSPPETDDSTPTTTVTLTNPYATTSPPNAGRT
ncbi:hypothetical protein [Mycolicibacterium vinylchloridicum]|uniref:hypothetical protein n=1 Tax=Mycolicibacterium vinylchloridicum TaxID=2736928 RepID=UPI0015C71669|nr:hypothetical protein [Mycolicibacterium vinylchloridicum]